MRRCKSLFVVLSLIVLVAFTLTGCGSAGAKWSGQVLRVGVDDTYPPMEYRDDQNNLVGFDVDFAKAIGEKLGVKVEFISTAWDGIYPALNANKFDCIISSCSETKSYIVNYAFTKPYLSNGQYIVVKPSDNSIAKPEDLKGKKVGAQVNTTSSKAAEKFQKTVPFTLTKYDQVIQPFADLKTGRIEAIVVDAAVGRDYQSKDPASYKVTSAKLTNEPIGIAFSNANKALRDKVNTIIDGLRADGTLKAMSIKWLQGEDNTSNIDDTLTED